MHLKVVRAVLEVLFQHREPRHTAKQHQKQHQRRRIQPRAERQPQQSAAPETGGCRQPLDLVAGAEQDRVSADRRHADDCRCREDGQLHTGKRQLESEHEIGQDKYENGRQNRLKQRDPDDPHAAFFEHRELEEFSGRKRDERQRDV